MSQATTTNSERELPDVRRELTAKDRLWMKNYRKLEAFKRQHAHCRVPEGFGDTSLAKWVDNQRTLQHAMRKDRKQLLNALGFIWKKEFYKTVPWMDRYNELVAFKKRNGHSQVPAKENKVLQDWINSQRTAQRNGTLRQDREQLLNEIEFVWIKQGDREKWMDTYNELVAFKQKHGHIRLSGADDKKLSRWICSQRYRKTNGTLSKAAQKLLDTIGFVWNHSTGEAAFDELLVSSSVSEESAEVISEVPSNASEPTKVDQPFAVDTRAEEVSEMNGGVPQPFLVDHLSHELFDKKGTATPGRMIHCENIQTNVQSRKRASQDQENLTQRVSKIDSDLITTEATKTAAIEMSSVAPEKNGSSPLRKKSRKSRPFSLSVYTYMRRVTDSSNTE